jgi:hypothetical protein
MLILEGQYQARPIVWRDAILKKTTLILSEQASRPISSEPSTVSDMEKGNENLMKGDHLMKTIKRSTRRSRTFLLSIVCAGAIATLLGGCAEGPYVTAYDTGYYYPTTYYTPDYYDYPYSYYGPTYRRTVVHYGPRYYSYWY